MCIGSNPIGEATTRCFEEAKVCSLICVDEIINELSKAHLKTDLTLNLDFWQEVKQQINKNIL